MSDAVAATPVASEERVFALDVIRGVALLGIFIMNMPGFVASFYSGKVGFHQWPSRLDDGIELFRNIMLGGKFNSMFSFLFGVGFTIQLVRLLERDGARGYVTYVRRLLALLAFGVLHACLLWTGDVLHIYALLGFALLLLCNVSDRIIVALIVLCVLAPPFVSLTRIFLGVPDGFVLAAHEFQRWQTSNNAAYGHGSFFDAAREHTREMAFLYSDRGTVVYVVSFYLQMSTTLLIGVLAGRHRWVQNAAQLMPRMIPWQWSMLVLGLVSGAVYAYGETSELMLTDSLWTVGTSFAYVLCRLGLVTFYVVTLLRMAVRPQLAGVLKPIATVGRMPLSNYLLQTLMATFIFYGWGLGYWSRGGPAIWFALAVALYLVVQVPLSTLWLTFFKYGPMEYVWRLLTYGYGSVSRTAPVQSAPVQSTEGALDAEPPSLAPDGDAASEAEPRAQALDAAPPEVQESPATPEPQRIG